MHKIKFIVPCLLAGCAIAAPQMLPNQTDATSTVWKFYGGDVSGVTPPIVSWVEELDCDENSGFHPYEYMWGPVDYGSCVGGMTYEDENFSFVAHPPYFAWDRGDFAHELYHSFLYQTTGNGDRKHAGPGWQPKQIVDQANLLLGKTAREEGWAK